MVRQEVRARIETGDARHARIDAREMSPVVLDKVLLRLTDILERALFGKGEHVLHRICFLLVKAPTFYSDGVDEQGCQRG